MEKQINIAEILAGKPRGTKLYSPICGKCELLYIDNDCIEVDTLDNVKSWSFAKSGATYSFPNAECLLFPSREMRDWSKFSWKKGDVLVSNDSKKEVIFDGFVTIDYTCFKGKHFLDCTDESNHKYKEKIQLFTDSYNIEEEDASKCYINTIEERLGGNLDMETLEVESKPKWEFKPFDRVIARNEDGEWIADIFSHKGEHDYFCVGGAWDMVLPYNDETAHLIGTNEDYKEG